VNRRTKSNRLWLALTVLIIIVGLAHLATQRIAIAPLHALLEERLSERIGLEITFDTLRAALLPTPHLEAGGVRVANLPGGRSPDLLRVEQVDVGLALFPLFDRIIEIDRLAIAGADVFLETDTEGQFTTGDALGAKEKDATSEDFRLDLRQLHIESLVVVYRDLRRDAPHTLVFDSVTVDSKLLSSGATLEARGQFDGSHIVVSGEIGSLAELFAPERAFPVDLEGQLFEATFEAKGSLDRPRTLEGLDLLIRAEIPELVVAGRPLPRLGTIHFTGQLSNRDGSLGLENLSMKTAPTYSARIDVQGKMDDLRHLSDIDVDAHIETGPLDFLAPVVEPRFEPFVQAIASLSASAKLSDASGTLHLEGSIDTSSPGKAIVIHAEGGSKNLKRVADIDLDVEARVDDLTSITSLFPDIPSHSPLGAATARAHLKSHEHSLRADGIEIRIGEREKVWAEVDGSISDVIGLRGVDLELLFGSSSLHHLRGVLAREFPETSAFEGAAGIHDKNGSLRLKHARIHGGNESPIEIHIDARFDELPGRDEIEIDLALRGEDASVLGAIAGMDLPAIRPIELSGKFHGPLDHVEVEGLELRLGQTQIDGSLSGSFTPDEQPKVKARLASRDARLQDFGINGSRPAPDEATNHVPSFVRDIHAQLPFEALRHVDLDLGLEFDHLGGYQGFDARDVRFNLMLEDGLLELKDASAVYQDGNLDVRLRADARKPAPKIELAVETKGMNLARIMSQFDVNTDYSGVVDAEIDLHARGDTIHALQRSLTGSFGLAVRDGNAASKTARQFVLNLAEAVFRNFRRNDPPSVGCAIAHLEIENGIASVHTLLLKGEKITVTGTGQIDLVRREYELRVVPRNSNPGIVSFAPEVEVSGPLEDPRFTTIKRTLATSFARGVLRNTFKAGGALLNPFRLGRKPMQKQEEDCRLTGGIYGG
jgi:uncharacterized protein involved in outer membrane biogenesis